MSANWLNLNLLAHIGVPVHLTKIFLPCLMSSQALMYCCKKLNIRSLMLSLTSRMLSMKSNEPLSSTSSYSGPLTGNNSLRLHPKSYECFSSINHVTYLIKGKVLGKEIPISPSNLTYVCPHQHN